MRLHKARKSEAFGTVTDWNISSIRDAGLEAVVSTLYSDALPYHNFAHAQDTLAAAETIIRHCMREGIRVDPLVVYYGLLFHDAGYHENHRRFGFASKEAYSADLAARHLRARKVPPALVKKVVAAIMSTHRDGTFVTAEQKAVRAADLSGLAADYPRFRTNTLRLKEEFDRLNGTDTPWSEWIRKVTETISFYLAQEIRLTSYFANPQGESAFHAAVSANLAELQKEA